MSGRAFGPPTGVAITLVTFLPTSLFYMSVAPSLSLGTALAALIIAAMLVSGLARSPDGRRAAILTLAGAVATIALVAITVAVHGAAAANFQPMDAARALASLLFLGALVLGGFALAEMVKATPSCQLDQRIGWIVAILLALALIAAIGIEAPSPPGRSYDKPIFPFTEPSHLTLALMPLYLYACVVGRGAARITLLILGLVVVVAVQSLTFAVGWLIAALACARGLLMPMTGVAAAGAIAVADLAYFADRLDFGGESQNLSALVYIQGWELMVESFERSHGFGLGFQQLGVHGTDTASSRLIFALLQNDANILDGGFTASKLVSEFGGFGIIAVAALLWAGLSSLRALRRAARDPAQHDAAALFAHAVIAAYMLELMVRGAGYFTGSTLLLIAALRIRFTAAPIDIKLGTARA